MSTRKPASLDGSLLARKGDAAPAISIDSPLLEELGEPRPDPTRRKPADTAVDASRPPAGGQDDSAAGGLSSRPSFRIISVVVGLAVLFIVAFLALKQPPEENLVPGHGPKQSKPVGAVSSATATPASSQPSASETGLSGLTAGDSQKAAITKPKMAKADTVSAAVASEPRAPVAPPAATEKNSTAVAAVPRPAMAKPVFRPGRYMLQLAAVSNERSARRELARLERRLGGLLGQRKLIVVKAVPRGKPPVFRLRASSYETRADAREACKLIQKKKIGCLVIRR